MLLPELIPVLRSRIGDLVMKEQTEEIVLNIVKLLRAIVRKVGPSLYKYMGDYDVMFCSALRHQMPDIQQVRMLYTR